MSEIKESTAPQINPIVSKLADFSDRISPMIVKELRQGLRTRTFTGIFLILQVVLGLAMLGAIITESSDTGRMISMVVFFFFSIAALILQPLRGTSAVATELKEDTLEIMSLTRLSTVRIVYGKWASIVSQTALLLAATVPYLVMRYFFGGMQLFAELAILFTIFFVSVCLTAVTVGLSCSRSVLLRALVPLLLIPFGLLTISTVIIGREFGLMNEIFSFRDPDVLIGFLVFMILSAFTGYFFLDMGVGRIAALAENHAFRKRLVTLVVMLIVLLVLFWNPPAQIAAVVVLLAFSCVIGLDVCTEVAVCVPSVVKPFVKRGTPGRLLGRFFYPGWHSGLLLLLVMAGLTILIGNLTFSKSSFGGATGLNEEVWLVVLGVFYSILTPLLLIRIFIVRIKDIFPSYLLILILSGMLTALVAAFSEMSRSASEGLLLITSWIPGVWLLFIEQSMEEEGIVITSLLLLGVIFWLMKLATSEFKRTAELEEMAERSLREEES